MRGSRVFVIQCYKFLLYFIVVRNKSLQGLKKRREGNGKFTQWKKKLSCYTRASRVASRIFRITSSSSRFAWFELLMNQLGKENVTYLRHPNTSFTEQVTKKYSLIYFSTIHCNQHSLRCLRRGMYTIWCLHRRLWFLRNFKPTSIIFGEDQKENILFKSVNGVLFYSLQSAPASVFTHRNVDSFISHRLWCFVWLRSASYYNDERSSFSKSCN